MAHLKPTINFETNGHVVVLPVHFNHFSHSHRFIIQKHYQKQKEQKVAATMAAMAALQSSMVGLSLSSNSFLGQRLSPITLPSLLPVRTFLSTHHSFPNYLFLFYNSSFNFDHSTCFLSPNTQIGLLLFSRRACSLLESKLLEINNSSFSLFFCPYFFRFFPVNVLVLLEFV